MADLVLVRCMSVSDGISLIMSALIAIGIFVGLHRGDARFEPTAWFGAFLVIVGTTGIWPSVLAIVDHKPFVFAGIIWPRALSPWLATLGYALSTILGSALLIRAGAVGKYTKEHQ